MFKIQPKNFPESALWLVKNEHIIASFGSPDILLNNTGSRPVSAKLITHENELFIEDIPANLKTYVNQRVITHKTALNHEDILTINNQAFEVFDSEREIQKFSTPMLQQNSSRYWQLQSLVTPNKCFFLAPYTVIGKKINCDIFINHPSLDDQHVAMSVVGGKVMMKDLSSANGCTINGLKRTDAILKDCDEITLGSLSFRLLEPSKKRTVKTSISPVLVSSQRMLKEDKIPSPVEKMWKTKPSSQGNRENDQIDRLLERHKRFKTITIIAFSTSLAGLIATILFFVLRT